MKNEVESYLVRIYRRGTLKTGIAGTVEIIAKEKTKAFRSAVELLEIMKICSLSDRLPDKFRRQGKALKPGRINPEHNKGRKK
jgi:hypothetical protein